jgi:hypothetical protein
MALNGKGLTALCLAAARLSLVACTIASDVVGVACWLTMALTLGGAEGKETSYIF